MRSPGGLRRVGQRYWAAPYEITIALFTLPATVLFLTKPGILASTAVDAALPYWWTNYLWITLIMFGQAGIIYGWVFGHARWFGRPGLACLAVALVWYALFLFTERPTRSLLLVGIVMAVGAVMAQRSRRVS